jgi:cobalt-zinc-cadmium resistance protein CzcA
LYEPALAAALDRPKWVVSGAVLALLASLALVPKLGTEFLPELNEGTIWVNATLPPGISVAETVREVRRMREALLEIPEVTTTVSKAGRPEDGTDPKPINMVEIFVGLKPPGDWKRKVTKEQIISEMERKVESSLPGIDASFSQPIRDNVLESISQIDGQVVIKVFGEEPPVLLRLVQEVLRSIDGVRGVDRAFIDRAGEVPQARVEIDRARASRYGLNVGDVLDVVEIGAGGKSATELWEGERHFGVVTRLAPEDRKLATLERIQIDTPDGRRVPLSEVATVRTVTGAMNIARENGTRVTAIGVFVRGRDMGSVVKDMQDRVAKLSFPPGYRVSWSGEFENQQRAMKRLAVIVPISVFLIFVLLFNAFGSLRLAALILMNVPFALIGGILALVITGIPLSVSAAIGFIALFGQAVLNGVVMVSVFKQLEAGATSIRAAVTEGALIRMRTVLMTAVLAMLGLLPMALSHGIGSETQKPLAVVIIGGLVSATLLTLVVLPALYALVGGGGERGRPPASPIESLEPSVAEG